MGAGLSLKKGGVDVRGETLDESKVRNLRVLVVGGTKGIGKAIAESYAKHGAAEVIVVGRTEPADLVKAFPEKVKVVGADLSTMKSCVEVCSKIPSVSTLDQVFFTTGIITSKERKVSPDGIEIDLAVSALSRYTILHTLLSKYDLGAKPSSNTKTRVFIMGFPGTKNSVNLDDMNAEKEYKQFPAHMMTVVANEAFVTKLAKAQTRVNVYGLNPGMVQTDIRAEALGTGLLFRFVEGLIWLIFKSAETYAENAVVKLGASTQLEGNSGAFFDDKGREIMPSSFLAENGNLDKCYEEAGKLVAKALGEVVSL